MSLRSGIRLSADDASRNYCRDVLMPKAEETATREARKPLQSDGGLHAVLTQTSKLWNRGTNRITFAFLNGPNGGNDVQKRKVRDAIREWECYGDIHFEEMGSPNPTPPLSSGPGPDVRITFDPSPSEGSWSLVGTDALSAPSSDATMNLGWIDSQSDYLTAGERAVILHEFGHVLGMLHEHQSPSGGGVPLRNVQAAVKLYGQKSGWTPEMVEKQIIETYNLNDVSSFSRVDRTSIMHYPLPAAVTGLPDDIPYNYVLSDMDKAYIAIMYPRAIPSNAAPNWSLKHALEVSGVYGDDLIVSQEIEKIAKSYENGFIDPTRIRDLFSAWTKRAKIRLFRAHGLTPGLDRLPPVKIETAGKTVLLPGAALCSSDQGIPKDTAPEHSLRAVVDEDAMRGFGFEGSNNTDKGFCRRITWEIVACPQTGGDGTIPPEEPNKYQRDLLVSCLGAWAEYASVAFAEEKQSTPLAPNQSHIIFTFQSHHYGNGSVFKLEDPNGLTSYCLPESYEPTPEAAKTPGNVDYGKPPVKHTICLRGIGEGPNRDDTTKLTLFGDDQPCTVERLNTRTMLHEIGHFLGLEHEEVGIYGWYLFHTDLLAPRQLGLTLDEWQRQWVKSFEKSQRFIATKFDFGSVMDVKRFSDWDSEGFVIVEPDKDVRPLVRTVTTLSAYDMANVAFLHPGRRFFKEGPPEIFNEFNKDFFDWCCNVLQIGEVYRTQLLELASGHTNWNEFRRTYFESLTAIEKKFNADGIDKLGQIVGQTADKWQFFFDPSVTWTPFFRAEPVNTSPAHGNIPAPSDKAHDLTPGGAAPQNPQGLLDILYSKLSSTFGPTGAQILSLQIPTRYLAKEEYQFELSGIYSNFVKPVVVSEAEFRFTDALYDAAPIVSAPNGRSLSMVYNQVLNNFVPMYSDADRKVREERERIRAWLLTEVGDQNPYFKFDYNAAGGGLGEDPEALKALSLSLPQNKQLVRKMTRMEFASELTQEYYEAQKKWELERDEMINNAIATHDPVKLATATRQLVHIQQSEQGKLGMKNADSVVRGYSHIVREALGHLDVATPAEILQDAKDAFRTSAFSSLYGASRVYPVLMGPVDWAAGLDTGFAPEDLAENPDIIIMNIETKSAALDTQKKQLALLQASVEGKVSELKDQVDNMAKSLNKVEAELSSKYLDSTVQLAKIALALATDGASEIPDTARSVKTLVEETSKKRNDVEKELEKSVKALDPDGTIDDITKQLKAVDDAQRNLQMATNAWNAKRMALARAEATDTKSDQAFFESNIARLNAELADLNARLVLAKKAREQKVALAQANHGELSVGDLATGNAAASMGGGSRWQEIAITHTQQISNQSATTSGSASSRRWSTNLWLASGGGSNESSEASLTTYSKDGQIDLEITMKATLVTVDRSSWFQPQLFDNSKGYMRNNSAMSFTNYAPGQTPEEIARPFHGEGRPDPIADSMLPAYPVGYIIVKDALIKVSNINTEEAAAKKHLTEQSQSSGGFLFFSYNKVSSNSKDTSTASFEIRKDGMLVRIPGPQILGYIQQIVPRDESAGYDPSKSLAKEFYLPPTPTPDLSKNHTISGPDSSGAAHDLGPDIDSHGANRYSGFKFDVRDTSMTPVVATSRPNPTSADDTSRTGSLKSLKPAESSEDTGSEGDSKAQREEEGRRDGESTELVEKILARMTADNGEFRKSLEKMLQ